MGAARTAVKPSPGRERAVSSDEFSLTLMGVPARTTVGTGSELLVAGCGEPVLSLTGVAAADERHADKKTSPPAINPVENTMLGRIILFLLATEPGALVGMGYHVGERVRFPPPRTEAQEAVSGPTATTQRLRG